MAAFSKLFSMWEWCFVPGEQDSKHLGWKHPVFALFLMAWVCYAATTEAAKVYRKINPELKNLSLPPYAKKAGAALLVYVLAMLISRMREDKSKTLYDMTWACNITLLLSVYALLKNKPLLLAGALLPITLDLVTLTHHLSLTFSVPVVF